MFPVALRVLSIKDLKDLSFLSVGVTIDMQDLKNLKRCFYLTHTPAALRRQNIAVSTDPIIL